MKLLLIPLMVMVLDISSGVDSARDEEYQSCPVREKQVTDIVNDSVEDTPSPGTSVNDSVEDTPSPGTSVNDSVEDTPSPGTSVNDSVEDTPSPGTSVNDSVEDTPSPGTSVNDSVEDTPSPGTSVNDSVEDIQDVFPSPDTPVGDCCREVPEKTVIKSFTKVPNGEAWQLQSYAVVHAIERLVYKWNDLSSWPPRNDSSTVCQRDVQSAISSYQANEFWALQLFDSWAKPGPSLLLGRTEFVGNYYQCRDVEAVTKGKRTNFRGNYCVVTLVNVTHTVSTGFVFSKGYKYIKLGTCMPNTCSLDDVTGIFQERIDMLGHNSLILVSDVDCRTDEREYTNITKLAIATFLVIATLCVIGTAVDVADNLNQNLPFPNLEQQNELKDGVSKYVKLTQGNNEASLSSMSHSSLKRVLLSFSVWTNGGRLLSTSSAPESVTVINGIRFLTMVWILIGHAWYQTATIYGDNSIEGTSLMIKSRQYDVLSSITFGVDTFFVISGFLVSYNWVKPVIEQGWKFGWSYFCCHRYWRVTPPLMLTLLLEHGLQGLLVSGAVAPSSQPKNKVACQNSWWLIPLYLNNVFFRNPDEECFINSWSLSVDMQFHLVSPLMLLPFYYHKYAGIASCLFFIISQWMLVAALTFFYQWSIDFKSLSPDWYQQYYCACYSRIGPFALGVLAGYVFTANQGRVPMKPCVAIGWIVATTTGIAMMFGCHGYATGTVQSSVLEAAVAFATSRTIWGACILWIIIACSSGYGGPVNAILSWTPFTVLSRVTYFAYLTQFFVSVIIFQNLERPVYLNYMSVAVTGISTLVLTCGLSAVLTICVEYPMINLEKNFFGRKKALGYQK